MDQIDINAYFQELTTQESLIFIAFCLGAFLFGLLFGVILRGRKVRRLKRELKKKDRQIAELQETISQHDEQIALKEADLKKAAYDLNQAQLAADRYEQEKNDLHKQVYQLRNELDKNQESGAGYGATLDELNDQILGLKTRNQELQTKLRQTEGGDPSAEMKALQQQVAYLKQRNEELQQQLEGSGGEDAEAAQVRIQALQQQVQYLKQQNTELAAKKSAPTPPAGDGQRIKMLEAQVKQLQAENDRLQTDLTQMRNSTPAAARTTTASEEKTDDLPEPEPRVKPGITQDIFASDRAMLRAQEGDDLSLIDGIGPFLEKKLNDVGVTTYKQMADWSAADIARITKQIQYFEGRIEKDNWVGQAKILRDTPTRDLPKKPAESLGVDVNQGDDLKVVEGIGPKIEAILKSAGITTLAELAKADPADLEMMLTQADARYRMHEATTWPAQARLAANGDWDVLEDYQETLKGGRDDYRD